MALQLEMGNPLAVIEATAEGFVVDNPGIPTQMAALCPAITQSSQPTNSFRTLTAGCKACNTRLFTMHYYKHEDHPVIPYYSGGFHHERAREWINSN
eukprot:scaffold87724_cov22-Cyclotella_meneghiniana.AAC.2